MQYCIPPGLEVVQQQALLLVAVQALLKDPPGIISTKVQKKTLNLKKTSIHKFGQQAHIDPNIFSTCINTLWLRSCEAAGKMQWSSSLVSKRLRWKRVAVKLAATESEAARLQSDYKKWLRQNGCNGEVTEGTRYKWLPKKGYGLQWKWLQHGYTKWLRISSCRKSTSGKQLRREGN